MNEVSSIEEFQVVASNGSLRESTLLPKKNNCANMYRSHKQSSFFSNYGQHGNMRLYKAGDMSNMFNNNSTK